MKKKEKNQKLNLIKIQKKSCSVGFTLVEIIVTISVFSLIFGVASGMFVSAIRSQRKSLVSQELLSQTSYVMEYMSRHLRMAKNYNVASTDCTGGGYNYEITRGGNGVKFANYEDPSCCWEFYLENNKLNRAITECVSNNTVGPLTSANFTVDDFNIYLIDSEAGAGSQPRLTLALKIRGGGEKLEEQSTIEIQTTISQRALNEGDASGGGGGGGFVCGDLLRDSRDGVDRAYETIEIGGKCWMEQGLNIGQKINAPDLQGTECSPAAEIKKYCYDNDERNCDEVNPNPEHIYPDGGLYSWSQAMCGLATPGPHQGICPLGWHIPTDQEVCELEHEVDPTWTVEQYCSTQGGRGTDCGAQLQPGGSSGFNFNLGGYYWGPDLQFYERDTAAGYMLTSSVDATYFYWRSVSSWSPQISRWGTEKTIVCAKTVRCIQD